MPLVTSSYLLLSSVDRLAAGWTEVGPLGCLDHHGGLLARTEAAGDCDLSPYTLGLRPSLQSLHCPAQRLLDISDPCRGNIHVVRLLDNLPSLSLLFPNIAYIVSLHWYAEGLSPSSLMSGLFVS